MSLKLILSYQLLSIVLKLVSKIFEIKLTIKSVKRYTVIGFLDIKATLRERQIICNATATINIFIDSHYGFDRKSEYCLLRLGFAVTTEFIMQNCHRN